MNKIILYCRSGFEKECGEEITDKAKKRKIFGFAHAKKCSGYVIFECYRQNDIDKLIQRLPLRMLIFARQMFVSSELLIDLPLKDRITPILTKLKKLKKKGGELRVEVADTNDSKVLIKLCRKLSVPLRSALRNVEILTCHKTSIYPVIHVFFINTSCCYIGYSSTRSNSPFYMGIPRIKRSIDAPSRSSLKLKEAFHVFIPIKEWGQRLANGMYAVDLGACPGGWTYQLVKRNMWVYSVDNGLISKNLIDSGYVTWYQEDGFRFRPKHNNISWMVCDILEQPGKIATLVAKWLINRWCRETIFNLKLPMKNRYITLLKNIKYIQNQLDKYKIRADVQARQLYHDRKEVTVHIRLL